MNSYLSKIVCYSNDLPEYSIHLYRIISICKDKHKRLLFSRQHSAVKIYFYLFVPKTCVKGMTQQADYPGHISASTAGEDGCPDVPHGRQMGAVLAIWVRLAPFYPYGAQMSFIWAKVSTSQFHFYTPALFFSFLVHVWPNETLVQIFRTGLHL